MNRNLSVFEGFVSHVSIRQESSGRSRTLHQNTYDYTTWSEDNQVLSFRLEIADRYGNIEKTVVELRGKEIWGSIADGDEVEVTGVETKTGISQPQRVFNITTQREIIATPHATPPVISRGCFDVFFVLLLTLIVMLILSPIIISIIVSIWAGNLHPFIVLVGLIAIGLVAYLLYKLLNKHKERR
jgi:hypothetical protein